MTPLFILDEGVCPYSLLECCFSPIKQQSLICIS